MTKKAQNQKMQEPFIKTLNMQSDITGSALNETEPDGLFYTNFSREDAISFVEIFEGFFHYYTLNPSIAVATLKRNLKAQMNEMQDICPMEVLLFGARILRDTATDREVKDMLISLIIPYIPGNLKSVYYIINGWEWVPLLCILIEACGMSNQDKAIKLIMDAYPRLIMKCKDQNTDGIMQSYIQMLENTQNEDYLPYLYTIITHPAFLNSSNLTEFFLQKIKHNGFFAAHHKSIVETVCKNSLPPIFRRELEKLIYNGGKNDSCTAFQMKGLSYEKKVEKIKQLDFSIDTSRMLFSFERSKEEDERIVYMACKKLLSDLPKMRVSDKNRAIILVGSKGVQIKARSLVEDILKLKEEDPQIKVCAAIALSDLDPVTYPMKESVLRLLYDSKIDTWEWAVGKYFRFRRGFFEHEFLSYVYEELKDAPVSTLAPLLYRFLELLKTFHGKDGLLCGQKSMQKKILLILENLLEREFSLRASMALINLFDFILFMDTKKVLLLLDRFKEILVKEQHETVLPYVDALIKKGDIVSEPDE